MPLQKLTHTQLTVIDELLTQRKPKMRYVGKKGFQAGPDRPKKMDLQHPQYPMPEWSDATLTHASASGSGSPAPAGVPIDSLPPLSPGLSLTPIPDSTTSAAASERYPAPVEPSGELKPEGERAAPAQPPTDAPALTVSLTDTESQTEAKGTKDSAAEAKETKDEKDGKTAAAASTKTLTAAEQEAAAREAALAALAASDALPGLDRLPSLQRTASEMAQPVLAPESKYADDDGFLACEVRARALAARLTKAEAEVRFCCGVCVSVCSYQGKQHK